MTGAELRHAARKRSSAALASVLIAALVGAAPALCGGAVVAHGQAASAPPPTAEAPAAGTAPGTTSATAPAQTLELAPATDVPPPPPNYQSESAVPADPAACFPACRSGFLCHERQCISACNPQCAPGQQCTDDGRCVGNPSVPAAASGARKHDGFMLRLSLGIGGGEVREHVSGDTTNAIETSARTTRYAGVALGPTLDLGGSLSENLVLHGRLSLFALPSPRVTDDGNEVGTSNYLTVNTTIVGPALSYYFMPLNAFVTAAIALGSVRFDFDESSERSSRTSGTGLGLQLDGGKEWWVGDSWGLGAALRLEYIAIARHDDQVGWTREYSMIAASAMFSATYQ
jgi:hypothetical protein